MDIDEATSERARQTVEHALIQQSVNEAARWFRSAEGQRELREKKEAAIQRVLAYIAEGKQ